MKIERLKKGDIIGIVCPSMIPNPERLERNRRTLNALGYRVQFGENVLKKHPRLPGLRA
ncbi:MAG: hypothetical protein LBD02_08150 [Christensenellaceae bacterium]|jgi:muramoyltetrapeptide carboxypeptidase LdcA involved in peptidoglycan recycling|nr:hypothetical protein [Christensenellaceae bacterium]